VRFIDSQASPPRSSRRRCGERGRRSSARHGELSVAPANQVGNAAAGGLQASNRGVNLHNHEARCSRLCRLVAAHRLGWDRWAFSSCAWFLNPPEKVSMPARVELFGVEIDPLRMDQAVAQVFAWVADSDGRCRFVVTPNVDHVVMLQHHDGLRAAYRDAGLVLVDGAPVLWSSRLLKPAGSGLPERVAGADFVPALFAAADPERPLRVFLLGAAPGVADRAAANMRYQWPAVHAVGTYSPPLGFEHSESENEVILSRIAAVKPDVLVVGLGAPKQELWVHKHQRQLAAKVALCVGATIDFLAGGKSRAPLWMRDAGLEWLYRMATEPRRLAARYAKDAWIFPQLVAREWWRVRNAPRS
jgi:N-acetylglucosaminyldiphosphoundecaprenol N-acetyl-beta-D-mannosaminyltransferase